MGSTIRSNEPLARDTPVRNASYAAHVITRPSHAPTAQLTRLLSSAFGGRANTVLVVCVAPGRSDSFETLNSLQFGQQAMSVKVQAKVR